MMFIFEATDRTVQRNSLNDGFVRLLFCFQKCFTFRYGNIQGDNLRELMKDDSEPQIKRMYEKSIWDTLILELENSLDKITFQMLYSEVYIYQNE